MYVTNEQSKTPIFQINQHIGDDKDILGDNGEVVQKGDGMGIDGIIFADEVLSFNENPNIDELVFYTNSQGGDVQKSLDIFNSISMSKKKTHSIITGFAFSCAGWIPLAADKVDMVSETGRWMCHMPYDPENPEEKSQFMDEVVDIISKVIASKSGRNGKPKKTQEEIKKLMKEKTYWDAERMHKEGLIDNIVNSSGKVIRLEKDPILLNKQELNFFYKEYQFAQNKLVIEESEKEKEKEKLKLKSNSNNQKINNMSFLKAVNRFNAISKEKAGISFNLTEDSSEEVIVDAIAKLENRLRAMNDEMMDKEDAIKKKDGILLDSKNALDEAKKMADDKAKEANDAMCSYNSMKEKFDNMEVENKTMKEKEEASNKEKLASELKFKTERATNFVDKLIEQKKVVATENKTIDEVKQYLVNKAIENFDDLSMQYSIMPIRVSAAKTGLKKLSNGTDINASLISGLIAQNRERIEKKQYVVSDGVKLNFVGGQVIKD